MDLTNKLNQVGDKCDKIFKKCEEQEVTNRRLQTEIVGLRKS